MRARRPGVLRWVSLLGALWAVIAMAPSVEAHAFLLRSTPAAGARLTDSPPALSLLFSEPVTGAQIALTTADGAPVSVPSLFHISQGNLVEVPLPSLGAGVYRVSWQVAAADSHPTQGQFAFAIGAAGQLPVTVQQSTSPVAWPEALVSWLLLAPLFLAFGGLASERVIWPPVARRHGTPVPGIPMNPLLGAALGAGIAQFALVLASAGVLQAGAPGQPMPGPFLTPVGRLTLLVAGLIGAALVWARVPYMRAWTLVPLGAALVLEVLRGHTASAASWWAAPADVVHVLVVAVWIGGLGHLLLVLWCARAAPASPWLIAGARRYATLALGLVALALASGFLVALAQVPRLSDLVTTSYGVALLSKLALVAAAVLAAFVARRALPALSGGGLSRISQRVRVEIAVLGLVLAAATVLANAAPPIAASAAADLLGPPPIDGPVLRQATLVGFLAVYVAAAQDRLQVQVLAPSGDPAMLNQLAAAAQLPDGSSVTLPLHSCGRGCGDSVVSWPAGTTDVAVDVSSPDWGQGVAHFSVAWPLQSEDPALVTQVVASMRAQPTVEVSERISPAATGSVETTYSLSGEQFIDDEAYAAGGAADVHPVPAPDGLRGLTVYIPGSFIWYEMEVDGQDRIVRETVADPGHLLQRSLRYPAPS